MDSKRDAKTDIKQSWDKTTAFVRDNKWTCLLCSMPTYFTCRYLYIRLRNYMLHYPPGPIGLPWFGTMLYSHWLYKGVWTKYLAMTYGGIVYFPMVHNMTQVVISDSAIAKQVIQRKDCLSRWDILLDSKDPQQVRHQKHKLDLWSADDNLTKSFLHVSGEPWQRRRRVLQHSIVRLLTNKVMNRIMNESFVDTLCPLLDGLCENREPWQVLPVARYLTFNTVFLSFFGFDERVHINDERYSSIIHSVEESMTGFKYELLFRVLPFTKYMYPRILREYLDFKKSRNAILRELILNRMRRTTSDVNRRQRFVMDDVIALIEDGKLSLSEAYMDLFILFLAATHTTSHTLEFGMALIANNMDSGVVDTVRSELLSQMQQQNANGSLILDLTKVNNCPHFRAFVHEVMRISSVVPLGVAHLSERDIWVTDDTRHRYKIPRKTSINYNVDFIHRYSDKEQTLHWTHGCGDDVHLDNWLVSYPNDPNRYFRMNDAFINFGAGRRDCVGKTIAIRELYAMLGFMILNYRLGVAPDSDDKLSREMVRGTYALKKMQFVLTKRY